MMPDKDSVLQYYKEINDDLNRLGVSTSTEDVTEIVPMLYLRNNDTFYQYICNSNNE